MKGKALLFFLLFLERERDSEQFLYLTIVTSSHIALDIKWNYHSFCIKMIILLKITLKQKLLKLHSDLDHI